MSFEKVWLDRPLRERLSVTMLRHENTCSRAGYLYAKYRGAGRSNAMERGTALHEVLRRATMAAVDQDEPMVPPELVKAIVAEVIAEPALRCPMEEHDYLRECAYRWGDHFVCQPRNVLAVEQFMVLELPNGWVVRGVVDYAELLEGGAAVRAEDYKSARAMMGEEEVGRKRPDGSIAAKDFQLVCYALMLVFGRPAARCETCEGHGRVTIDNPIPGGPLTVEIDCETCAGRGYHLIGPLPLAGAAQRVDLAYTYPGIPRKDGSVSKRECSLTRLELEEYRDSLLAAVERVRIAEQTGDWPAASGSHCTECPCKLECPIPTELRDYAGAINSPEEAAVVAEVQDRARAKWDAVDKELKTFVKKAMGGGPLRFGRDQVMEVKHLEYEEIRDKDELFAAVQRSTEYGEPFERGKHVKVRQSNRMTTRRLTELELEEELRDQISARDGGP
jgi:hypothetical protein